jgi:hypothetical protein
MQLYGSASTQQIQVSRDETYDCANQVNQQPKSEHNYDESQATVENAGGRLVVSS